MGEHRVRNAGVVGSSPMPSTNPPLPPSRTRRCRLTRAFIFGYYGRNKTGAHASGFGTHVMKDVMDKVIHRTTPEGNEGVLTNGLPGNRNDVPDGTL